MTPNICICIATSSTEMFATYKNQIATEDIIKP